MMRLLTWTFSTLAELRNGKRAAQTMELWMHAGGCYARKKRKSRRVRLYNLGQKVLRILLFPTHRRPTLRIWHHGDPSPHPSLVNVV